MVARAVVGVVGLIARADDGDAQRVEAGIDDLLDALGPARVGVHVDLALLRPRADELDARRDVVGRERRLTLAALAEAHDAVRCDREVVDADLGDLLRCRAELDALLRRWAALGWLQGDAAKAVGIADGRGRDAALPAAVEEVLRRAAVPLERAAADLLDNAVARQVLLRALDELRELLRVVVHGVPLLVLVRVDGRTIELVLVDDDGRVAVERQALCLLRPLVGRQVEARVAGRQDGGHGEAAYRHRLAVRALADGQAVRQKHEVRALR